MSSKKNATAAATIFSKTYRDRAAMDISDLFSLLIDLE
jgi:hypothetical protein